MPITVCMLASGVLAVFPADAGTQAELDALREELRAIRAQREGAWLDEARAAEVRALVHDVLADAGTRASFRADSPAFGYDEGFVIRSGDGSMLLRVNMLGQARFVWNNNWQPTGSQPPAAVPDTGSNRNDQNTWGMETRRAQLYVSGHVMDPSVEYMLGVAYDTQPDPYFLLQNAYGMVYLYVRKNFGEGFTATLGRQNAPFTVESTLFNAGNTQMGEYSIFEYRAGLGQQTGLNLAWTGDQVRWQGGWFNDVARIPGNIAQWDSLFNAGVALASRLEWKPAGTWRQFADESSYRGEEFGLVLGGGVAWATGRAQNRLIGVDVAEFAATGDVRVDFGGANLIGQVFWQDDVLGTEDQWGLNLQGGVFLADAVEAFGALSWFDVADPKWFVQAGGNWYLDPSHKLKVTVMGILPLGGETVGAPAPSLTGTGVSDVANNFSVLAQIQVMF
ncbi:MAG: porin [Planctomycetota bacterium]